MGETPMRFRKVTLRMVKGLNKDIESLLGEGMNCPRMADEYGHYSVFTTFPQIKICRAAQTG